MAVVDGAQGEVLVSLQNVVALTHAGFPIASDGSPWREIEKDRGWGLVGLFRFGWFNSFVWCAGRVKIKFFQRVLRVLLYIWQMPRREREGLLTRKPAKFV